MSKYYILNTCDRPYPRHVCQLIGDRLYYMDPELFPRYKEGFPMTQERTPMEEFGFEITEDEEKGKVIFNKTWLSRAKYEDGHDRDWQGDNHFVLQKLKTKEVPDYDNIS